MGFSALGNATRRNHPSQFNAKRTFELFYRSPFTDWANCSGNIIDLYQTPGDLVNLEPLGRVCIAYKIDGIIRITWVGGAVRFTQELFPGSIGCAAPLSVVNLGQFGHAYLGTNGTIYHVTQNNIDSVSQEKVSITLPSKLSLSRFRYARGFAIPTQDLYVLLYDSTGLSGQFLDSYVTWNYRTSDFTRGKLGQQVIAGSSFQPAVDSQEVSLVTTNDKVLEYDSINNTSDDDGTYIDRYWTTGWQKLSEEEGYLYGVALEMKKADGARIKVSIARDMFNVFTNEQTFNLRGLNPTADFVECEYRLPSPIFGSWFNVKVNFYHDKPTAQTELRRIGFIAQPKHGWPSSPQTCWCGRCGPDRGTATPPAGPVFRWR